MISSESALSGASAEARELYGALLNFVRTLGTFQEEPKKTSVHLTNRSAFVGVQFRRTYLILTIKAASRIDSPRVLKAEQVSRNRWHCEVKITAELDIDDALRCWIRAAYQLCA